LNLNSPLIELFSSPRTKTYQALSEAGLKTIKDLLFIFPKRMDWIPNESSFEKAVEDSYFKGRGLIKNIHAVPQYYTKRKGQSLLKNIKATVEDLNSKSTITLRWFNSYSNLEKKLKGLEEITFYGKVNKYKGQYQIINPHIGDDEIKIDYPNIGEAKGFNIKKIIQKIPLGLWDELEDQIPKYILDKRNLPTLSKSLKMLHGITHEDNQDSANDRLKYEVHFNHQLKIILRKNARTKNNAPVIKPLSSFNKILPFELTADQNNTLIEIISDLNKGIPMMRLVQGDVGCGKTAIAILSSHFLIENSYQVAMLCPTEALAIQHYNEFSRYFKNTELLLGSTKASHKKEIYNKVNQGQSSLIIGTHALLQEGLTFKNLGLFVIDEQHKFGVDQRNYLIKKYPHVHSLIMSATPIPRSLRLAQYGDIDISTIKTLPSFKKPVKSKIVDENTFAQFLHFIKNKIEKSEQAFFVVPKIENEESSLNNLTTTTLRLKKIFPLFNISHLHGKMTAEEKKEIIDNFKNKKIQILISTTVIEVGINIPNATIMAVLNPERFGLSTLHQLRGRVGRGEKQGYFFLIQEKNVPEESIKRLKVIEKHSDGFLIAEKDLEIRGQGDLFGTDQSGRSLYELEADLLKYTHEDILEILSKDKNLLNNKVRENFQLKEISSTL